MDLSLENRRARKTKVFDEAVESITANKVALKYPTITAEESPNAIVVTGTRALTAAWAADWLLRPVFVDPSDIRTMWAIGRRDERDGTSWSESSEV